MIYNKLVRDNIPKIIESNGKKPLISTLNNEDYKKELDKKLLEEVNEYLTDDNNEELADVLEVIMAILEYKKVDFEDIDKMRLEKKAKRGGFRNKIFLEGVV
jgi:Uncharacterized conserved protein